MSRRKKFAFITWIGPSVSPLKKAKVSTDKAFVKAIVTVSRFKPSRAPSMPCIEMLSILSHSLFPPLSLSLSLGLWEGVPC